MLYSPMIRSQSFSELVPLNTVSFPHLGGTGWPRIPGVGYFPSPGQLGSNKNPSRLDPG